MEAPPALSPKILRKRKARASEGGLEEQETHKIGFGCRNQSRSLQYEMNIFSFCSTKNKCFVAVCSTDMFLVDVSNCKFAI